MYVADQDLIPSNGLICLKEHFQIQRDSLDEEYNRDKVKQDDEVDTI